MIHLKKLHLLKGKVQTQNIEDDKSENEENNPKSPLQLANEKLSCKAMCTKEKIM